MKLKKRNIQRSEISLIFFQLLPVAFIWLISLKLWPVNLLSGGTKGIILLTIIIIGIIVTVILRNQYSAFVWFVCAPAYVINALLFFGLKYFRVIGPENSAALTFICFIEICLLGIGVFFLIGIYFQYKENKIKPKTVGLKECQELGSTD